MKVNDLKEKAKWVWKETVAIHKNARETRIASSLSCVEIFTVLYYSGLMKFDSKKPLSPKRDRCIVSKGHGSICLYPILSDLGFFNKKELNRVCQPGGILGGIPDPVIPGYETVNGSLGHGLGVGTGLALGLKTKGDSENVFVIVGDGELHEGANWEAIMFASHHNLDNLIVIVDNNKTSMLDHTDNIISHDLLEKRILSFGWLCKSCNGHDVEDFLIVLKDMLSIKNKGPKFIIANTIKGKGIPGLENEPLSHIINPKEEILDSILK